MDHMNDWKDRPPLVLKYGRRYDLVILLSESDILSIFRYLSRGRPRGDVHLTILPPSLPTPSFPSSPLPTHPMLPTLNMSSPFTFSHLVRTYLTPHLNQIIFPIISIFLLPILLSPNSINLLLLRNIPPHPPFPSV